MNKSLKIANMNFIDAIKVVSVYYLIFISILVLIVTMSTAVNKSYSVSGLELTSMIFIFVCGLNSFKENFYLSQSNNISRKTFLRGIILSIIFISMIMATVDFIINRIMNLFMLSPTIYDMGYTALRNFNSVSYSGELVQSNSILTIINTIFLTFVLYCFAYILGLVINMIYFRSNTLMKIAISVIGGALLITTLSSVSITKVLKLILGINTQNVYIAIFTFVILFIALLGLAKLLIKEATIKVR